MNAMSQPKEPLACVPCVMVLGTRRRVGKSVATGAFAALLRRTATNVGVFKPVSVGCRRTRQGLVSPDTEFLAHCADSPHELATINPIRFHSTFVPAECARRSRSPLQFGEIDTSYRRLTEGCDLLLVEGVGGLLEPLDEQTTMLDLAVRWRARVVIVASAWAGAVGSVLMAVECVKKRNLDVAVVLLNRYRPDSASLADELNPEQVARYAGVPVPFVIPNDPATCVEEGRLGTDTTAALKPPASRLAADR